MTPHRLGAIPLGGNSTSAALATWSMTRAVVPPTLGQMVGWLAGPPCPPAFLSRLPWLPLPMPPSCRPQSASAYRAALPLLRITMRTLAVTSLMIALLATDPLAQQRVTGFVSVTVENGPATVTIDGVSRGEVQDRVELCSRGRCRSGCRRFDACGDARHQPRHARGGPRRVATAGWGCRASSLH